MDIMALQSTTTLRNLESCLGRLEATGDGFDHHRQITLESGVFSKAAIVKIFYDKDSGEFDIVTVDETGKIDTDKNIKDKSLVVSTVNYFTSNHYPI
jgi:hypothetical protein